MAACRRLWSPLLGAASYGSTQRETHASTSSCGHSGVVRRRPSIAAGLAPAGSAHRNGDAQTRLRHRRRRELALGAEPGRLREDITEVGKFPFQSAVEAARLVPKIDTHSPGWIVVTGLS